MTRFARVDSGGGEGILRTRSEKESSNGREQASRMEFLIRMNKLTARGGGAIKEYLEG